MRDKKIIGYFKPLEPLPRTKSPMLVGCKRCNETWYEDWDDVGFRKNSAHFCYDYCSECKTEDDNEQNK